MNSNNCCCQTTCTGIAVAASIIVGVITALLRYTAIITVTPAFLWVLFGIAIGILGIELLTSSLFSAERTCCGISDILLVGVLGTILTAVVLLGVTFAATSAIGAIITGALLFFFSLVVTTAVCLIKCRNRCD